MPLIVLAQRGMGCPMMLVAMFAIAFVSWVVNQISAQNKAGQRRPGPRPARPRNDRIQQEIDQFIQEAAGRRPARRDVLSADEIEVVSPPPRGRRPAPRRSVSTPARVPRPVAPPPAPVPRPGQAAADRRLTGPDQLGAGLTDHVRTHMDSRVDAQVQKYLPHSVDQEVSQHLGSFAAQSTDMSTPLQPGAVGGLEAASTQTFLEELRAPGGVRRAIVMQEILQRPLALRNRRR